MKLNIIKKISLAVLLMATLSTCERDDICPEDVPTTPRLLIKLYNVSDQETIKNAPNLFIQGIGSDSPLSDFNGDSSENTIELPLKTNENSTQFSFIKNYAINNNGTPNDTTDDYVTGNEDIITINYVAESVYVSRACGYKTVYKAVSILLDDDVTNRWIVLAQPLNNNQSIEDETTTHFNFFH